MGAAAWMCLVLLAGSVVTPRASATGDEVAALLDRVHDAASRADEDAYFACFTEDGVFLGTDAAERWTMTQFREYAHPHFAAGKGWTYRPVERHVTHSRGGKIAWFDEILSNEKYGRCRGTGVAVREGGRWLVAHYSLTFLVPNDAAAGVVAAIKESSP